MASPEIKTEKELTELAILRFLSVQGVITYFGQTSIARAWARAIAWVAQEAYQLLPVMFKRFTLQGSDDPYIVDVARERGAGDKLPATNAQVYVVVRPFTANVSAITSGATDLIEVDDSSGFSATDSIRIRNGDGSTSEIATIIAITTGTGPGGGDELEVATLGGTYTPGSEDVDVLLRETLPEGTVFTSSAGISFESLSSLTTGDSNPIMDGESTSLSLADKVWCEAQVAGADGNIDPLSITGLSTPVAGVIDVFNPAPGFGGSDGETNLELKRRTANGLAIHAQETAAWFEAIAQAADNNVLRLLLSEERSVGTVHGLLVKRGGGTFSTSELAVIERYIEDRVRSQLNVDLDNYTPTSLEIEARITLDPDADLETVWKTACDALAEFTDPRKWQEGTDVDEADLIAILKRVSGLATLETSTFSPSSDVVVADTSLPIFARLSLEDIDTGDTINAELAVSL